MAVVRIALIFGADVVVVTILRNRLTVPQNLTRSDVATVYCTWVSIAADGVIGAIQALVHKGTPRNGAAECRETTGRIFSGRCFYTGFTMHIFCATSAGVTDHGVIAAAVCGITGIGRTCVIIAANGGRIRTGTRRDVA